MKRETPERAAARRRATRSEVDQFAPGLRQPDGGRGGFDTAHSDASPGGTSGEHSGQVSAGADSLDAERDHEDEGEDNEAPETPLDEPPPVPIGDPPADATPRPPLTAAAPFLDRIGVAVGELSDRPSANRSR